jgi:hypothetical protein
VLVAPRLRVLDGGVVLEAQTASGPWEFQAACVEAFVASWRARGFSPVTIDNDIGQVERALILSTSRARPGREWQGVPGRAASRAHIAGPTGDQLGCEDDLRACSPKIQRVRFSP